MGPTEVKAFRHFLQLYGKSHKVVLVQLGGSSMINGKRKDGVPTVNSFPALAAFAAP